MFWSLVTAGPWRRYFNNRLYAAWGFETAGLVDGTDVTGKVPDLKERPVRITCRSSKTGEINATLFAQSTFRHQYPHYPALQTTDYYRATEQWTFASVDGFRQGRSTLIDKITLDSVLGPADRIYNMMRPR